MIVKGPFGRILEGKPLSLPPASVVNHPQVDKQPPAPLSLSIIRDIDEFFDPTDFSWLTRCFAVSDTAQDSLGLLLNDLKSQNHSNRALALLRINDFCLGCLKKNQSHEEHITNIIKNNLLIFDCRDKLDILPTLYSQLVKSISDYYLLSKTSNGEFQSHSTIDWVRLDCSKLLSCIYCIFLINLDNPSFAEYICNLDPYPPTYFLSLLNDLYTGNRQNFPLKKVVLLLWKFLIAIIGNDEQIETSKQKLRERTFGKETKHAQKNTFLAKASIQDFHNYCTILHYRYPGIYLPDANSDSVARLEKQIPPYLQKYLKSCYSEEITLESRHAPIVLPTDALIPDPIVEGLEVFKNYICLSPFAAGADKASELDKIEDGIEYRRMTRISKLFESLIPKLSLYISMLAKLMYYLNVGASDTEGATEDIDLAKYKDVITSAVCNILFLLQKGSKLYHPLALEYTNRSLVDGNIPILSLKMLSTWFVASDDLSLAWLSASDSPTLSFFHHFHPSMLPLKLPLLESRPFKTAHAVLEVLYRQTKRYPSRIAALILWKSLAVIKRITRLEIPQLSIPALKLAKIQLPRLGAGKRWKTVQNMRLISQIYQLLKPKFMEDYLTADMEVLDGMNHEAEMKKLVDAWFESQCAPPVHSESSNNGDDGEVLTEYFKANVDSWITRQLELMEI